MTVYLDTTENKKAKKKSDKLDKLIGPTDKKVDDLARDRIITARVSLLLRHSFFGNLATRLTLINADEWCATAATDGRRFYYNSRFIMMLKPKEVEFLVAHEILHVVYDHIDRRGDRDPQLFNIANDYAVNADLKRHQIGEFITTVPCLYDRKYDGKSSEEIYDDLYENAEKIDMDKLIDMLLDEHLDDEGEGEGEGEDGEDQPKNKRPKMSQSERDQLRQEMKEAIINAAQGAEPGSVPKGIERLIDGITNPIMPWRDLVQVNLTSIVKNDFSWMRPSRRGWHMDAIMPGMNPGEEIDAAIALDMSGSISIEQGREMIGEVASMMEMFNGFKLHVFCFDTTVHNPADFTSENLDQIEEYEPKGGGGTDFDCIFNYLKENDISPSRLVVFTDGYPWGSWGDENYCDVSWIIHGTTDVKPPWGQYAYYDEYKKH